MKVAVTGASGFIGSATVRTLRADGHDVVRLVRRTPEATDEVRWDPASRTVDLDGLRGVDAIVHLAGAGVGDKRWTPAYKEEIRRSRVDGTAAIAAACVALDPAPRVLLSGSATGFYGDTGETAVDETAPGGTGFLGDVVREWEAAAAPAIGAGVRVAHLRTGIVLSGRGGTLGGTVRPLGIPVRLLTLFRSGLAGPLGSGRQWVSWISLDDELAAIRFLLDTELAGPVNLTSPQPIRNKDWVSAIGRSVNRPAALPVPGFALKVALGEFSHDVLGSQRVLPRRLEEAGFDFAHTDIDSALAAVI